MSWASSYANRFKKPKILSSIKKDLKSAAKAVTSPKKSVRRSASSVDGATRSIGRGIQKAAANPRKTAYKSWKFAKEAGRDIAKSENTKAAAITYARMLHPATFTHAAYQNSRPKDFLRSSAGTADGIIGVAQPFGTLTRSTDDPTYKSSRIVANVVGPTKAFKAAKLAKGGKAAKSAKTAPKTATKPSKAKSVGKKAGRAAAEWYGREPLIDASEPVVTEAVLRATAAHYGISTAELKKHMKTESKKSSKKSSTKTKGKRAMNDSAKTYKDKDGNAVRIGSGGQAQKKGESWKQFMSRTQSAVDKRASVKNDKFMKPGTPKQTSSPAATPKGPHLAPVKNPRPQSEWALGSMTKNDYSKLSDEEKAKVRSKVKQSGETFEGAQSWIDKKGTTRRIGSGAKRIKGETWREFISRTQPKKK